ncbi:MAG: hypothetical protein MRY74_14830 [Neomegalonema sp.]|nr:hypothetical protein [Neomegalonema sp.]
MEALSADRLMRQAETVEGVYTGFIYRSLPSRSEAALFRAVRIVSGGNLAL